jgi:TonB family protein
MLVALSGCSSTPDSEPTYVSETNKRLDKQVAVPASKKASAKNAEQMKKIWADRADVARLNAVEHLTKAPKLLSAPPPEYPSNTRARARVIVTAVIDEQGNVEAARIFRSAGKPFDEAALEAVRQWRFQPAQSPTGPTKTLITVPLEFEGRMVDPLTKQYTPEVYEKGVKDWGSGYLQP